MPVANQVLIEFNANCADEFMVSGFKIMDSDSFIQHMLKAAQWFVHPKPRSLFVSFGSNQGIEWSSFDEYCQSFKVKAVTDTEADVITTLIGKEFGKFLQLEQPEDFNEKAVNLSS